MSPGSATDIGAILTTGGESRVALLRYCVMSVTMEPVFVFLAQEYSLRPTHAGALALFDIFCARDALARIRVPDALPPRNLQLQSAADVIRLQSRQLAAAADHDSAAVPITVPPRHLFAPVANAASNSCFAAIARSYDPARTPHQNLPGGTLNPGQRHFVENIWRPIARPRLAHNGFWQIANIE